MSKDFEYIKELFDSDGIKAPESLSEENMLSMLNVTGEEEAVKLKGEKESTRFEPRRARPHISLRKWMAVVAVAIFAVFATSIYNDLFLSPPDTSLVGNVLYTFKSENEIEMILRNMDCSTGFDRFKFNRESGEDNLIEYELEDSTTGSEPVSSSMTAESTDTEGHSETYLQVDDVDEADIVKTDSKYIYYVTGRREVIILSTKGRKAKKIATIGSTDIENYINDIYVKGDKLITIGTIYKDDSDEASSGIVVYDISRRGRPTVLYDFSQTGSILSSRMVGNYVYLITKDYVDRGGRKVPMCGSAENMQSLDVSEICCVPDPHTSSYIVLSAVDISSTNQRRSVTRAVLGPSEQIYCNDHNLYCTSKEWSNDKGSYYTRIVRASLNGLSMKFNATTTVPGYVNSQFSMDERDGYFRIATTSERAGMDVNNLYVLDSELKESGKVTGFARNESIKAVRFIGDKAYVITYEAIDPLFIIDLSDPARPLIEGEVKIDGFSTLLIPVSKDRLLGIGHATGDNGYGGEYDSGLKLALFDISEPSKPKVLDSKEFKDMTSIAQYDHHALMINSEEKYFAIPYEIWNYDEIDGDEIIEDGEEPQEESDSVDFESDTMVNVEPEYNYDTGVLLFKADDKIHSADRHKLEGSAVLRNVYIGDWIYALDAEGNVQSFKPAF